MMVYRVYCCYLECVQTAAAELSMLSYSPSAAATRDMKGGNKRNAVVSLTIAVTPGPLAAERNCCYMY